MPRTKGASKMSDDLDNGNIEDENENFADMLEAYSQGMNEDIQVGDKINGTVISIGEDTIYIDTGTKLDGVVDKSELLDENGDLALKKGDRIDLYVVSLTESEIRLSKALAGFESAHLLYDAFKSGVPVEGKVTAVCKGGLNVEIMKKRAFCPISQIDVKFVEQPEDYVGQTYNFLIKQYEQNGRNIVVSRRTLLEKDLKKARDAYLKTVSVDNIVEGRVSKLMPFGAFVELFPGVEGMIHISELSWSRVSEPGEVVKEGDTVSVQIIGIDQHEKTGKPKIALSLKQATGDPWLTLDDRFKKGDKVTGKVTRCAGFGAFVEIAAGVEGLVHISEMSYLKRVHKAEDMVSPGDTVSVMIKDIDSANKRISLSMRDAEGDPWVDVLQKYKIGQTVKGTIDKKEQYGYFVTLEPGITGLYPKSKIDQAADPSAVDKLKVGETVTVIVEAIQPDDRRITLGSPKTGDADAWQAYSPESDKPMGDLAEKLKRAMRSKK